jgi:ribosomal-protein-alanine N-acetyltransferase
LPVLETARLRLRTLRLDDAADQQAFAGEPEVAGPGMWDPLPTLEENQRDLMEALESQARGETAEWGIEHQSEGRLIGRCGFLRFRPAHRNAELGYALSRSYWRQGYMSEAVAAVLAFGFDRLDLQRVEANCLADNTASCRLLEKAGFALEGTARQAYVQDGISKDLRRYAVLRHEFTSLPASPTGATAPATEYRPGSAGPR